MKNTYYKLEHRVFTLCLLAGSMISLAPAVSLADFYVSSTGSDWRSSVQAKNPATPWKTLQKAADSVSPGSVVHVAPGTYPTLTTITKSGTASAHITFISDDKWGAKIQGSSKEALLRLDGSYIDIKNFEFTGTGSALEAVLVTGSYDIISGNKIHDITGSGILTWKSDYKFGNIDILNNLIYTVGSSVYDHGIYIMYQGGSVSNNIVYDSTGFGIHAWHAANGIIVSNNTVFDCSEGGITIGAGDSPGGIVADNFVVTNNIVMYNGDYGITEHGATGTNNIYSNNLLYQNLFGAVYLQNGNNDQNTLTADPLLVNFMLGGGGDYHLSSSSPAINNGTLLGAPSVDFDGTARTGNPDIGAYEYK